MGKLSSAQMCYQLVANLYPNFCKKHFTELMAEIWSTNFCSSPSSLFFFFPFFTEGGRGELQVVHVVPCNQHFFLKPLCVHDSSLCSQLLPLRR